LVPALRRYGEVAHVLLVVRMMQPSSQLVRDLARRDGASLVSCYVPIARSGSELRQTAIHMKNCQRTLADAHAAGKIDASTLAAATSELDDAARAVEDPRARRTAAGIALFAAPDECVTVESPAQFVPLVTIGPRFYLVPLVPYTMPTPSVYVLALSRHAVRVVQPLSRRELHLSAEVPRSLTDVVGRERRAATLHHHAVGAGSVFHGQGEGEDDVRPELEAFCRRVAQTLAADIDRTAATLLLAGDVQITAIFRAVAQGWTIVEQQIHGNHDRTSAEQLAALAEPLLADWRSADHAELRSLYGARCADRRASDDPIDIAAAARAGRIDTLLLDEAAALDEPRRRAARDPHTAQPEGRFNNEAVLTLRCGGDVRLIAAREMPTGAPQAAIYRF
jgi:hypothetical protein